MHSLQQLQQRFEEHLATYTLKEQPSRLYDACRHILSIGGKRIRPVALLMSHNLFQEPNQSALHAATAIELFHNFTLIHDDIMDAAPLRRGQATVHQQWDMPTAILSGDVMNIYAYAELNKIEPQYLHQVYDVFNTTAIEVCEGQQMDMDFELRDDVSIDEYINMIALKTSVLLACSIKIGAILGGATDGTADLLYAFGKNLGISFQLKDDYLDAFGDPDKTGKQAGGDILANKKTYLHLKAYEKANAAQRQQLLDLQQASANKVQDTLALFEQLEIKADTQSVKEHYSKLAFDALEQVPVPDARKSELRTLAEFLLNRDY
ncbi:MAG: hypothetical protein RL660_1469 [Bacteroidota bacterium]|jgi:geranylgeranyl diphosphate synthase type II